MLTCGCDNSPLCKGLGTPQKSAKQLWAVSEGGCKVRQKHLLTTPLLSCGACHNPFVMHRERQASGQAGAQAAARRGRQGDTRGRRCAVKLCSAAL